MPLLNAKSGWSSLTQTCALHECSAVRSSPSQTSTVALQSRSLHYQIQPPSNLPWYCLVLPFFGSMIFVPEIKSYSRARYVPTCSRLHWVYQKLDQVLYIVQTEDIVLWSSNQSLRTWYKRMARTKSTIPF